VPSGSAGIRKIRGKAADERVVIGIDVRDLGNERDRLSRPIGTPPRV